MAKRSKSLGRGVKLCCPVCGEREAVMNLDLSAMCCTCEACGDSFAPETACKMLTEELARWEAVCQWVALAGDILSPDQSNDADSESLAVVA